MIVLLVALLGGAYLVFQCVTDTQTSRTPAMEELRMAYARGESTEEGFEARQNTLERSE